MPSELTISWVYTNLSHSAQHYLHIIRNFFEKLSAIRSIHGASKNVHNFACDYLCQKSTDFNNFGYTESWVNYAYKFSKFF